MIQLECRTCETATGQFLEAEWLDRLPEMAEFILEHMDHTVVAVTPDGVFPVAG